MSWTCEDCGRPVFRWELLSATDPETIPPTYAVVKKGKIVVSFFEGIVAECASEGCLYVDHEMGFKSGEELAIELPNTKIIDEGSGEQFEGKVKVQHNCGEIITVPDDLDIDTGMDKKRFVVPFKVQLKCPKCELALLDIKGEITGEMKK